MALETEHPSTIRRTAAFSEAVYTGRATVEGLTAVRAVSCEAFTDKTIPLLVDPEGRSIAQMRPAAVVDAILAKKNLGTSRDMAPLTIALGPGFTAGMDVDYVVETQRGHDLGRVIATGTAAPNTGVPGIIGGYGPERVLHAPCGGTVRCLKQIGDIVEKGEAVAEIEGGSGAVPVAASLTGLLRGLIRDGYTVTEGFKIADIDPRREEKMNCYTISDKARCIAGSVLELVCRHVLRGLGL